MTDECPAIIDWIHPPSGVEEKSLWHVLHDGELVGFNYDPMECRVRLEFDSPFHWEHHHLPESMRLYLDFTGVSSMRAERGIPWPGGFPKVEGEDSLQRNERIREYHAKWLSASMKFSDFADELQAAFSTGDSFTVLRADLLASGAMVSMRLSGFQDEKWTEWIVRGTSLAILLSDGRSMSVEELQKFGESYWEAWSNRSRP